MIIPAIVVPHKKSQLYVLSELKGKNQHNGDDMQELIEPDGTNDLITSFQRINHEVGSKENSGC